MIVKFTLKGSYNSIWLELIAVISIFAIALFTRTYELGNFPYFPPNFPWLGDRPGPAGMYRDEVGYMNIACDLFKNPTTYQPWLQLFFINLSIRILGENAFAARLPSALAASITAVLVYFVAKQKFGKVSALMSSLYFIAMVPVLIYNRMVFLENFVAMFFLTSIYFLFRYEREESPRWLYASSVLAGASMLAKINGLIAPLFFTIYVMRYRGKTNIVKSILVAIFIPILSLTLLLVFKAIRQPYVSIIQLLQGFLNQWWVGLIGREMSVWQYLIISSMPSGYMPELYGYLRLEYWYLFTYFCIAYLAMKEPEKISDITMAIMTFIALSFMVWGLGSYYLIIIHPIMALPVGYAILKLLKMSFPTLLAFLLFLYAPLAVTLIISVNQVGIPTIDAGLYAVKIILIGLPLVMVFTHYALTSFLENPLLAMNTVSLVLFIVLLLIGSYAIPALYPHYFSIKP